MLLNTSCIILISSLLFYIFLCHKKIPLLEKKFRSYGNKPGEKIQLLYNYTIISSSWSLKHAFVRLLLQFIYVVICIIHFFFLLSIYYPFLYLYRYNYIFLSYMAVTFFIA